MLGSNKGQRVGHVGVTLSAILVRQGLTGRPSWGHPKVTAEAILGPIKAHRVGHIGITDRARDPIQVTVGHFVPVPRRRHLATPITS